MTESPAGYSACQPNRGGLVSYVSSNDGKAPLLPIMGTKMHLYKGLKHYPVSVGRPGIGEGSRQHWIWQKFPSAVSSEEMSSALSRANYGSFGDTINRATGRTSPAPTKRPGFVTRKETPKQLPRMAYRPRILARSLTSG